MGVHGSRSWTQPILYRMAKLPGGDEPRCECVDGCSRRTFFTNHFVVRCDCDMECPAPLGPLLVSQFNVSGVATVDDMVARSIRGRIALRILSLRDVQCCRLPLSRIRSAASTDLLPLVRDSGPPTMASDTNWRASRCGVRSAI